ncbi:MFS transporter [Dactylosporangium aurantiacum]|uniref:MFS transporter n=1 Tax=Dactylosporangium aurantiacum TaxID=35754 RepID=A0A9Q9IP73_9ACTN|nr:MFS transporter [Dactylosporangium aurantiacum]MDG6104086.1 MFS transporter [Dactylosporangium aurantiacum]UWZ56899.1 MFS transporter [Dactylosporangium aurantiacum]
MAITKDVDARRGRADLGILTAGLAVSVAGDAAAFVALLLRLQPHGSGWVAALLAAELVPFVVLAPLVGRVVDRYETRGVLILALLGQAMVAVPLALLDGPLPTVLLFAGLAALSALVRPATNALIPAITGPAGRARGFARLGLGFGLGWIAGPAAGGLLTGWFGVRAAVLADAGTFAVLAGACALLSVRRAPAPRAGTGRGEGGLRLLVADRVLFAAVLGTAVSVGAAIVDNVAAPFRFIDQLGASQGQYGLYLTLWGIGALAGAQALPLVRVGHRTALALACLICGAGIAGIGAAPTLLLAYAAATLGGVGNGVLNVAQNALVAERTPAERHGRVFATVGAVSQTAIGGGTAAAAPLVGWLGGGGALIAAGVTSMVATVVALLPAGGRPSEERAAERRGLDRMR